MATKHPNIRIVPCDTDWYAMDPCAEGNRYCQSCQKEVVDMSAMSNEEVIAYLKANPGSCGNFFEGQVNVFDGDQSNESPVKRLVRNPIAVGSTWKKAAAAAATLALLHGQMPAEASPTDPVAIEAGHLGGDNKGDDKSGPSVNTMLTGIVVDQNGRMVPVPLVLKIYRGSEVLTYPIEVSNGLFAVDLQGKADPSDRLTIVIRSQTVNKWTFAKSKTRTLLGEGQNLTVEAEVIKRPPPRRSGGRTIYPNEI
jgi:hypothetical protein